MTLLLKSDKSVGEPASLSLKSAQTDQYNTVYAGHKSIINFIDLPASLADAANIDDVFLLGKKSTVSGAQTNITTNKGVSFVDNATDKAILLPDFFDLSKYAVGDNILMCFWVKVLTLGAGTRAIAGYRYSSNINWTAYLTSAGSVGFQVSALQVNNAAQVTLNQSFLLSIHIRITSTGYDIVTFKNKEQTNAGTTTGAIPIPTASSPRIGKIDGMNSAGFICHRAFLRKFDSSKTTAAAIASDEYDKFFSKL
ncbi:hypothetical protein [Acinetobacter soli]|uniref:hypothetical protein n=1 Tax=Acinetobacter soli TaxID=487316 RepID=UPI0006E3FDBC|nr:hypothetical protein [Acinetobacter soli]KQD05714.1 hypothetical protein APD01_01915 [Acinetobacter soli]